MIPLLFMLRGILKLRFMFFYASLGEKVFNMGFWQFVTNEKKYE
jgi:hypothetical protein